MKPFCLALSIHSLLIGSFDVSAQTNGLAQRDVRYRLQADDKVEVQYRLTPEFNGMASIQPDGYVSLPLVGQVKLAGLTLEEAAAAIRRPAGTRLNEPEVSVLLREYAKPFFVLAGEVARPGRVEMRGPVTLIEAIAMGGGFKDSARRSQVVVLRRTSADEAEVKVFDLRKLMSPSGVREDVAVRPGDLLVIPRNTISKIEPYVRIGEIGFYALAQRFL